MGYTIGLAQSGYPADGDVLAQARAYAQRAVAAGCRLLVFPENFMWPKKLSLEELVALAEPVDGSFVQAMAALAGFLYDGGGVGGALSILLLLDRIISGINEVFLRRVGNGDGFSCRIDRGQDPDRGDRQKDGTDNDQDISF